MNGNMPATSRSDVELPAISRELQQAVSDAVERVLAGHAGAVRAVRLRPWVVRQPFAEVVVSMNDDVELVSHFALRRRSWSTFAADVIGGGDDE